MKTLFVGPHPDDVDLGAGGTIKKFSNNGWDITILIVTKSADQTTANNRKNEAIMAAKKLGVNAEKIIFLDFEDGHLKDMSQDELRKSFFEVISKIDPNLIFGPSDIDRHDDHIAVNRALKQAARTRGLLLYHIFHHIDSSAMTRKVSIDISKFWKDKESACLQHYTEVQRGSITEERLKIIKKKSSIEGKIFESFDIHIPVGYDDSFNSNVNKINDVLFSRFWVDILDMCSTKEISLYFINPTVSGNGFLIDTNGRQKLLDKLRLFFPILKIQQFDEDRYSEVYNLKKLCAKENCLFSDGPLANLWTFRFIHGYPSFIFRKTQFIRPVVISSAYTASEPSNAKTGESSIKNCGAVIIMWGWCKKQKTPATIYAAGVSRYATLGSFHLLNNPTLRMCESVLYAKENGLAGIQVNFKLNTPKNYCDIKITKIDFLKSIEETTQ